MSIIYPVQKGAAYFAGLSLPFFVGAGDVAAAARERGFSEVVVTPRKRARFAFEVTKVPGYSDDWDHAFFGIYDGKAPTIEAPEAPTWIFEVRPQIPPPGRQVVAVLVQPMPPGMIKTPPASRPLLWMLGIGAVFIGAAALLEPVPIRRRAS